MAVWSRRFVFCLLSFVFCASARMSVFDNGQTNQPTNQPTTNLPTYQPTNQAIHFKPGNIDVIARGRYDHIFCQRLHADLEAFSVMARKTAVKKRACGWFSGMISSAHLHVLRAAWGCDASYVQTSKRNRIDGRSWITKRGPCYVVMLLCCYVC